MKTYTEYIKERLGISKIYPTMAITYDHSKKSGRDSLKPYVAKVLSSDLHLNLEREFLNRVMGGIYHGGHTQLIQWNLSEGIVYEYRNFMLNSGTGQLGSGYVAITKTGLVPLDRTDISDFLNGGFDRVEKCKDIHFKHEAIWTTHDIPWED